MKQDKMENLAIDDLDIEEVERRLELAPAAVAAGWCGCGAGDCGELCAAKCGSLCGVNVAYQAVNVGGGGGGGGGTCG